MLALDVYVPKQSFRVANPVFLTLEGSNLCISYPSGRTRVAKRRYYNDPPFKTDVKFVRHCVFNIGGADIFIAPAGLARNRIWNKKYPIGITLPNYSVATNVNRVDSSSGIKTTTSDGAINLHQSPAKTVFLDDTTLPSDTNSKTIKGDKEISREDVGRKTFYLYSRTSREKDDW